MSEERLTEIDGVNDGWVILKVFPAIVMNPLRGAPTLAASVNATDPLPVFEAAEVTTIHGSLAYAVHWQAAADGVTVTLPGVLAPEAGLNDVLPSV